MKIQYCSITGADDAVALKDLEAMAQEFPFVEWAVLWLPAQAGQPRCPSYDWIARYSKEYKGPYSALHLCSQGLLDFIEGKTEITDIMRGFKRIQLNLEFGNMAGLYDEKKLLSRIKALTSWEFIVQYTDKNKHLLPLLNSIPNHTLLFDTSAGRGISPDAWPAPIPGHKCGYAGGINPANVARNLEMIAHVANDQTTWIDMESGVRTNDIFDFSKVRQVLDITKPYAAA